MIINDKRTGSVATCPLDLCHSIGQWPSFLALWVSTRPQFLVLQASTRSRLLSSIMGAPVCVAMPTMCHHSDDVYMTLQPIAAYISAVV